MSNTTAGLDRILAGLRASCGHEDCGADATRQELGGRGLNGPTLRFVCGAHANAPDTKLSRRVDCPAWLGAGGACICETLCTKAVAA